MKRTKINPISKKQSQEIRKRVKLKKELLEESGYKCMTCGGVGDFRGLSLSHIVPLSRGGKTTRENCLIEDYKCHMRFEKHPERRQVLKVKQCESCGIIERGACCYEALINFRDHNICCHCVVEWKKREKRAKCSISFENFKEGGSYERRC